MNKQTWVLGVWFLTAIAVACSNSSPPAGTDGGPDAGPDAGLQPTDGGTDDDAGQDTEAPTAMGTSTGAQQTGTIGTAGGTLTSTDGKVTLTFPAGALTADTTIGIEPITNTAPGGIEGSYLLTAGGATFAQPVQITFAFADTDLAGTTLDGLGIGYQDDQGYWHTLDGVTADATARTLTVSSTHFSPWTGLSGFQIVPPSKKVSSGDGTTLFVYDCEPAGASNLIPNGAAMPPDDPCGPRPGLFSRVSNWSVDGIPGGNATVGTVKALPNLRQAIYTAPYVDNEEVHAVSAELSRTRSRGHVTLVSNITVEPVVYQVEGTFHDPGDEGVCPLARVDVDDHISFYTSKDSSGVWRVDLIKNTTTTVSNVVIGGDYTPGVFSWITTPEVITITDGTGMDFAGSYVSMTINGDVTAGVCQVVSDTGYTFGPVSGSTFPPPVMIFFNPTSFDSDGAQHVGNPGELWQFDIYKS